MIYSKRDGSKMPDRDDLDTVVPSKSIEVFEKTRFSPRVLPVKAKRKIRLRTRKAKRAGKGFGIKGAVIMLICITACTLIIDNRLFGSVLRRASVDRINDGANPKEQGITLYSRLSFTKESETDISAEQKELYETKEAATAGASVTTVNIDGISYYPITKSDLSAADLHVLMNETSYRPNMQEISSRAPSALQDIELSDEPLVLILHTHGGECYTDYEENYPQGEATRSLDTSKNVVRVGKEISDTLWDFGVPNLHCETMHDEKSFINAYNESAKTVRKYLEEYPSIRFVIDVHRDAIIRSDGEAVKAVKTIGGKDYAQLMFVVGTDERGHEHSGWNENLSLAAHLQSSIDSTYPGLCRSINLRDVPFNQWLSEGYLLLEVGTCSNTLDEALRAARAFGENLARSVLIGGN